MISQNGVPMSSPVPTIVAGHDLERVRLRSATVVLELFPPLELGVRTDLALDLVDPSFRPVLWGSSEQRLVHWLERFGERELLDPLLLLLLLWAADAIHHFYFYTPLNQSWLSLRRFNHPSLLETWFLQGSMVNLLRIRGREPLRSAPRLLGFTSETCYGDPGHRVVARCGCRWDPVYFAAPGPLLRWHRIVFAMLVTAVFTEGGGG